MFTKLGVFGHVLKCEVLAASCIILCIRAYIFAQSRIPNIHIVNNMYIIIVNNI